MALSYLIALRDGISKNAATMASALRDLSQAMRETQREASALGGVVVQVSNAVKGGGGAAAGATKEWTAKGLAIKTVTGYFVALGAAATSAGLAIGKGLVDAAAFREQQIGRFTAVLGDATKAQIAFRDSILIAEKTRFSAKTVSNTMAQIIQAVGADNAMARETEGRLFDLVSVNGGGDEELKQALGGIRDVINKGKLQREEIRQLINAGLGNDLIAREIGKNFNIKGKDANDLAQKVEKAVSAGKIRGELAVKSVLDAIAAKTGGGAAGQYAFDMGSSTISGLISNIKSGLETLAGLQDTSKWTGIMVLKDLLKAVADLFSSTAKEGKSMTNLLKVGADSLAPVFELLAGDVRQFGEAMGSSGIAASVLKDGLTFISGALYGVFWIVKWVTVGVLALFGVLTRGFAMMGEFLVDGPFYLFQHGGDIVDGLINGIKNKFGALRDAIKEMGANTVLWLKETLGIHSPSRVFAVLGNYTAQGFAQGIEGGAGDVSGAVGVMSGAAVGGLRAAGAGAGSRSIGGAGISITIAPTITSAAADPSAVAAEVLPQLSIIAQDAVEQALERMALA